MLRPSQNGPVLDRKTFYVGQEAELRKCNACKRHQHVLYLHSLLLDVSSFELLVTLKILTMDGATVVFEVRTHR